MHCALDPHAPGLFFQPLASRRVLLCVCGSIAAPKSFLLASALVKLGAEVQVVMSEHAAHFIGPLAFEGVTRRRPVLNLFEPSPHFQGELHIELSRWADVMLVVPASDNFIAKLAAGIPDTTLSLLAKNFPLSEIVLAPAMSAEMWEHPASQKNVALLKEWGLTFVGPTRGRLAHGGVGAGRMAEVEEILALSCQKLGRRFGDLSSRHVVVSAGGCREAIDRVRCISNASTGKQGHALAEAARDRGAEVTLVTTEPATAPLGLSQVYEVASHAEMEGALRAACKEADVYIGAAAVADYTVKNSSSKKIKREAQQSLMLELESTTDILAGLSQPGLIKVAFAAEVEQHEAHARAKLERKGAHLIVLNDVRRSDAGFGAPTNQVSIFDRDGGALSFPECPTKVASKYDVAWQVLSSMKRYLPDQV